MFSDMLCAGVKRGPHSTGIALASRKKLFTAKDTVLPWDLLSRREVGDAAKGGQFPVMMGHNRWATVGKINKENAHPFEHGDIVLTHNGTVHNVWEWGDSVKYDTDSEAMAAEISNEGIEKVYPQMDGAVTAVWYNKTTGRLNIVTNGQRPFNFRESEDGKSMYYASEDWQIEMAADARGVKLEKTTWTLPDDSLFEFWIGKDGKIQREVTDLDPFVPARVMGYQTPAGGSTGWDGKYKNPPSPTNLGVFEGDQSYGAANIIMTASQWHDTMEGANCALCYRDVTGLRDEAILIDLNTPVCGQCLKDTISVDARLI
jgi:hypothetical protein